MLKNHTVMEGIWHVTPVKKPLSLKRELADHEELSRSLWRSLQSTGRWAANFREVL